MESPEAPIEQAPDPSGFRDVFWVYEVTHEGDTLRYYGTPRVPTRQIIREVWPAFHAQGYDVRLDEELGEVVLIAEPIDVGIDGIPWTNVALAIATVLSTLFAGAQWYYLDPTSPELLHAWPFTLAIMGVLGIHELGHYVMSRHHGVSATLPYFIPVPTLIGTMGAVIKMRGQIPSRRALFDIGVAGPLAGLIATIGVTIVGLHLPPVEVPPPVIAEPAAIVELGYPPLLELLAWVSGEPLVYEQPGLSVNPVVIAGWVGMFVTFLNLIPVGQLDGGHIIRAILGERQELVAGFVPLLLFGLAGGMYLFRGVGFQGVLVWIMWGVITTFFVAVGPARPIMETNLDRRRVLLGVLTLILGVLCFHPLPVQVHT